MKSRKEKIRVGTIGLSYAHFKNFYGLNSSEVSYFKILDFISPYRVLMRFPVLKKLLANSILKNIHYAPFQKNIDTFHFFNTISFSNTPWITTFETFLPRWGMDKFGLNRVASNSCTGIVAMSECARQIMLKKVSDEFPEFLNPISEKLKVIHPSQSQNIESWDQKGLSVKDSKIFSMIGNDFFRKGGAEILRVFERLINEGANIELRIISNLKIGDYASKATKNDQTWALQIISSYPNKIFHFQNIPNSEVIELLKSTHIGLLPTYADTYGYSVLEFQSMACPVISTNVRALPEINNNERGWVIEVPKDEFGEGKYNTLQNRSVLSEIIETGLETVVREILDNPYLISQKGQKALVGIKEKNDPFKNGQEYLAIYQKALGFL